MASWAIAYDLDTKGMKAAGYSKGEMNKFYRAIQGCLAAHNFERLKQWRVYTGGGANCVADAFQVCLDLRAVEGGDRFIKRLHLFKMEDFNDLLPLVKSGTPSSDDDDFEEEIEALYPTPH